jgi:NAD-dependent dihydropyrimidine dehydrogenase PreA subunit
MENKLMPIIDWNRCDGCGKCAENCPAGVLEIRKLPETDYKGLKWYGKLNAKLKGMRKTHIIDETQCTECGLCVENCHEQALDRL